MPFEANPREVVLDAVAFLALVLEVGASAQPQDLRIVQNIARNRAYAAICVERAGNEVLRAGRPESFFISELEIVDEIIGAVFPAKQTALFVHILRRGRFRSGAAAAQEDAGLFTVLARNLDQVAAGRLKAQLAEIQVFVELALRRPEQALKIRREEADREIGARLDGDGQAAALTFVCHEEMRHVPDDRPAESAAELDILGLRLFAPAEQFQRGFLAHVGIGVIDEGGAVEFVGPRLRARGDRDRADLIELRLVVGADHAIFADRELGEGVAFRAVLAGHAVLENVVLLADPVDIDVHCAAVLRAALDARLAIGIFEHHPRRQIGEGEEVAIVLGQRLDLALRNVRADLAAFERDDPPAGHDDEIVFGSRRGGGIRHGRFLRDVVEVQNRVLRDLERKFIGTANRAVHAGDFEIIGRRAKLREIVTTVLRDIDRAAETRRHVDGRDLRRAGHIAPQGRVRFLRKSGRGERDGEGAGRAGDGEGTGQAAGNGRALRMRKDHGNSPPHFPPLFQRLEYPPQHSLQIESLNMERACNRFHSGCIEPLHRTNPKK